MTEADQKKAAKKFLETWTGKGYEKGENNEKENFSTCVHNNVAF